MISLNFDKRLYFDIINFFIIIICFYIKIFIKEKLITNIIFNWKENYNNIKNSLSKENYFLNLNFKLQFLNDFKLGYQLIIF